MKIMPVNKRQKILCICDLKYSSLVLTLGDVVLSGYAVK